MRSTLGTQISSSRTSAPSYGFGSASREQASKLFVSSEHSKLAGGKNASPGPAVYEQPSTLGPRASPIRHATLASPQHRSLSPNLRMCRVASFFTACAELASPFDSPPRWVFGTSSRFDKAKGTAAPSPDTYEQRSSLGAQINSSLPNQPMPSFGSSTRESVRKVYVSEKHSNSAFGGMTSNGPASYGLKGSIGQQQLSPNRSVRPAPALTRHAHRPPCVPHVTLSTASAACQSQCVPAPQRQHLAPLGVA